MIRRPPGRGHPGIAGAEPGGDDSYRAHQQRGRHLLPGPLAVQLAQLAGVGHAARDDRQDRGADQEAGQQAGNDGRLHPVGPAAQGVSIAAQPPGQPRHGLLHRVHLGSRRRHGHLHGADRRGLPTRAVHPLRAGPWALCLVADRAKAGSEMKEPRIRASGPGERRTS